MACTGHQVFIFEHIAHGKEKVNAVPVDAMKTYAGTRDIAPLIPNPDTIWRRVVKFTARSPPLPTE
jgi:hypothetical protein